MRKSHSITIKDLANIAGVSHSTVSRALNDSPLVNVQTRLKIQAIAREQNFGFNASARSLSRSQTGIIAVIYMADLDTFGSSLYAGQLFLELRHQLEFYQLDSILLEAYNPQTKESNISRLIRQNKVDGFLLLHTGIREEDYSLLRDSRIPVVQLHARSHIRENDDLDYYVTDNVKGGYLAAEHLLKRGCSDILTITVKADNDSNREFASRTEGFLNALSLKKLSADKRIVTVEECSYKRGYRFVMENRALVERADGLFVQADIMAFGVLCALRESGISVPGDIALIGYDDTSVCEMTEPSLSTVHQPREELSQQACRLLHDKIQGKEETGKVQVSLEPVLVPRETS